MFRVYRSKPFAETLFFFILAIQVSVTNVVWGQSLREAQELNDQVIKLYREGKYHEAMVRAERSLAIRQQALGLEHPHVAQSLNNMAEIYMALDNHPKAKILLQQALAIDEKVFGPDHPHVATDLNNLASVYQSLGEYEKSWNCLKRALAIDEKVLGPDHPHVAGDLNNLANLHESFGEHFKAQTLLERALGIMEKTYGQKHPHIATMHNNLAQIHSSLWDYAKAESLLKQALETKEELLGKEHPEVAQILSNLAHTYASQGNVIKARSLYERALTAERKNLGENSLVVARTLSSLGRLYPSLNNASLSEPYLTKALKIRESILGTEHLEVAVSLSQLAEFYTSMDYPSKAEPLYLRSLAIMENLKGVEDYEVAPYLDDLARFYKHLGDYDKAEPLLERSLAIREKTLGPKHPHVLQSLNRLAVVHLEKGDSNKASELFEKAGNNNGLGRCHLSRKNYQEAESQFLLSHEETEKKELDERISASIGLGFSYEGLNDFERAGQFFREAIALLKERWKKSPTFFEKGIASRETGVGFSLLEPYEGMIRILFEGKKEGFEKEALHYAEEVKAWSFMETVGASGIIKGKTDTHKEILERYRHLKCKIANTGKQLESLRATENKIPEAKIAEAREVFDQTIQEFSRLIQDTHSRDPELASLMTPVGCPSLKILQTYIDQDTTLIEYYVGKRSSYLWIITRDIISMKEIPLGKKAIDDLVNEVLFLDISDQNSIPEPIIVLPPILPHNLPQAQDGRSGADVFLEATQKLYHKIFAPFQGRIQTSRLIIIPHGALYKVPFATLNDGKQFLVDQYALSLLPAAAVIPWIVEKRNENSGQVLALVNPKTEYGTIAYSEGEISGLRRVFSQPESFTQTRASESQLRHDLAEVDVIHLACHGELSPEQPLESGLLLSADDQNDGILHIHELFAMDLPDVNLVTLSSCETIPSLSEDGQDLMALYRGFLYAGTPSLLTSFWRPQNRSPLYLLRYFYENWHQKGMSRSEALRQAQIQLKSKTRYKHPFYWASFVIIGDW